MQKSSTTEMMLNVVIVVDLGYKNWGKLWNIQQPDNSGGAENAVHTMRGVNNQWNDTPMNALKTVICVYRPN